MNKFEKLESDSKQKMDDYEKKIYDLEKSHIREQDRLKVSRADYQMSEVGGSLGCRSSLSIWTISE